MPATFHPLGIPGILRVEPRVFADDRGWFTETFKRSEYEKHGIPGDLRQDNHSKSARGVLRGLHYQLPPFAQGKLVRCTHREVFDVAVDIRQGSPTYGKWVSAILTAENHHALWVPEGFAHGFQALTEGAELLYKTTNEYNPAHERALRWDDPSLKIPWPIGTPIVHKKDAEAPFLDKAENTFRWTP